jgi:ligand-binding sensor domain-containing protein
LISYNASDLMADTVLALAVDEQHKWLWVGTSGGGLIRLGQDSRQADWRPYTPVTSYTQAGRGGLPGCRVVSIHLDGQRVYVGALESDGLGVLEPDGRWRTIGPPKGWGSSFFIAFSMADGPGGALWVGTNYGLYLLRGDDWSLLYRPPWDTDAAGAVRAVAVDDHGVVWFGVTGHGLALYDERASDAPWSGPFTTNNGLASNDIEAIALLPTGAGALIGTDAGLSVCKWRGEDRVALECEVSREPGLMGVSVHTLTISPDDERVLVGTDSQASIFLLSDF